MGESRLDPGVWRQHAWANRLQSALLLAAMGAFLGLLGWLLWGPDGVLMLLVAGALAVLLNPSLSPRWVMALYGASAVHPGRAPGLWHMLETLAGRAGLPAAPELYYVPSRLLNAFAVGTPGRSAIAVSDGLLRGLGERELAGVLAHEVSHIRSNDLWVMGLADLASRATGILSLVGQVLLLINLPLVLFGEVAINWLAIALLVFAPHLSALAQLALSRTREYDADLNAARLTNDPEGLASALARIEEAQGGWLERILMPGRRVPEPSLLRTHPETRDRIERLLSLKPRLSGRPLPALRRPGGALHPHPGRGVPHPPRWHRGGIWY